MYAEDMCIARGMPAAHCDECMVALYRCAVYSGFQSHSYSLVMHVVHQTHRHTPAQSCTYQPLNFVRYLVGPFNIQHISSRHLEYPMTTGCIKNSMPDIEGVHHTPYKFAAEVMLLFDWRDIQLLTVKTSIPWRGKWSRLVRSKRLRANPQ